MGDASLTLDPTLYENKIFLNGEYVAPSASTPTYPLLNPKDNTPVVSSIPLTTSADIDLAVAYAEAAFTEYSAYTAVRRTECIHRLAALLEEQFAPLSALDSLTSGNPVSVAATRERGMLHNGVLYYAGWTDKLKGEYFPADDGFIKLVHPTPLGVCAAITPFNAPLGIFLLKALPCLATGNVMILKPSEKTPLGSLALAPLFVQAGFPKGCVQVVTGAGQTGELLAKHMRIRKISFTGSIPTGKKVQVEAARSNLKRVTLELGGKSPAVVFEDADLENALKWTVGAVLARSGQVCVAATRVYVQKGLAERFIERYTEMMRGAVAGMGDPLDERVKMGPLVDQGQFEKVRGMVDRAKESGEAELVVGGGRHGETGCYMEPTVFLNPKDDAEIYKKEIFGPVSVVKTFDTEEEVLRMANDTEYGLMSGVFTKDVTRALRFATLLDSGVVGVNCISQMNVVVPFGGRKQSGIGREMGEDGLRSYIEPKTILINMNA